MKKKNLERERLKPLKETFKESLSPTTFIIYNTTPESIWNSFNPKITPFKESWRKNNSSSKVGNELTLNLKRKSSIKCQKEKEEGPLNVRRNLEASFNKIAQDFIELCEEKSSRKFKQNYEKGENIEEKKGNIENLKIDLKQKRHEKIKKKKLENNTQKLEFFSTPFPPEKIIQQKMNENVITQEIEPQSRQEIVSTIVHKNLIEKMRKKNQEVLGDIEKIEIQIKK